MRATDGNSHRRACRCGERSAPACPRMQVLTTAPSLPHRCGERSWVPKWDDGNLGEALRIGQNWIMFGPDARTYGRVYDVTAGLADRAEGGRIGSPEGSRRDLVGAEGGRIGTGLRRMDLLEAMRTGVWISEGSPVGSPEGSRGDLVGSHHSASPSAYPYASSAVMSAYPYATSAAVPPAPGRQSFVFPTMRWERALDHWWDEPREIESRLRRLARLLCIEARERRAAAAARARAAASPPALARGEAEVTEAAAEAEVTEVEVRVRTRTVPAPGAQQSSQWTARAPLVVRVPCG